MSSAEANTFNALRWPEGWGAHQVASSAVGRRAPHSRRATRLAPSPLGCSGESPRGTPLRRRAPRGLR